MIVIVIMILIVDPVTDLQEMAIDQILSIDLEMVLDGNLTGLQGMAQEMAIGQILSIDLEMVLDVNLTGFQGMAQEMAMDQIHSIGLEMALDPLETVKDQGDLIGLKKVVVG